MQKKASKEIQHTEVTKDRWLYKLVYMEDGAIFLLETNVETGCGRLKEVSPEEVTKLKELKGPIQSTVSFMNYALDYFIDLFSKISEEKWITGRLKTEYGCSVNGHLGVTGNIYKEVFLTKESIAFAALTKDICAHYYDGETINNGPAYANIIEEINNGNAVEYQQPTPKKRVLAALHDLKAQQLAIERIAAILIIKKSNT